MSAYSSPPLWSRVPRALRRLFTWTLVCSISAAPSFVLGMSFGHAAAMLCGVALFIVIYTAVTCTNSFERFYQRPFINTTMRIGYGLRILLSSSMLLAIAGATPFTIAPDMICGMFSVNIASKLGLAIEYGGRSSRTPHTDVSEFFAIFVTTCIQGLILNLIVFVVMVIAQGVQKAFRKPPADREPRGFEVLAAQVID